MPRNSGRKCGFECGFMIGAALAAVVLAGAGPALAASGVGNGGAALATSGAAAGGRPALAANERGCLVVDADDAATLRLQCGGELRTLRLASVRAPRPGPTLLGGEPYGSDGRELVRGWFVGKRVEVGGGTARLGGEDLRRGLLALGLVEWTGSATSAADAPLRAAEREARLGSRGLWSIDAWRRHQATASEPLLVPGTPALAPAESIGAAAARFPRKSEAERRAAFDAAVANLKTMPPVAAAAAPPQETAAPKAHRRSRGSRRAESAQPR